jgi:hypothetical protein
VAFRCFRARIGQGDSPLFAEERPLVARHLQDRPGGFDVFELRSVQRLLWSLADAVEFIVVEFNYGDSALSHFIQIALPGY